MLKNYKELNVWQKSYQLEPYLAMAKAKIKEDIKTTFWGRS